MDVILKAVGIHTKPGWNEKSVLLAPHSLPQEEPPQAGASSSSEKATHEHEQTQGPKPGDTPRVAARTNPSQTQVPTELGQSDGTALPPAASPTGSQICRHGVGTNPLGCPDCASETQD